MVPPLSAAKTIQMHLDVFLDDGHNINEPIGSAVGTSEGEMDIRASTKRSIAPLGHDTFFDVVFGSGGAGRVGLT